MQHLLKSLRIESRKDDNLNYLQCYPGLHQQIWDYLVNKCNEICWSFLYKFFDPCSQNYHVLPLLYVLMEVDYVETWLMCVNKQAKLSGFLFYVYVSLIIVH